MGQLSFFMPHEECIRGSARLVGKKRTGRLIVFIDQIGLITLANDRLAECLPIPLVLVVW